MSYPRWEYDTCPEEGRTHQEVDNEPSTLPALSQVELIQESSGDSLHCGELQAELYQYITHLINQALTLS